MELLFGLLGLAFIFFVIATFFMPWINRNSLKSLRNDVDDIKRELRFISLALKNKGMDVSNPKGTEIPAVEDHKEDLFCETAKENIAVEIKEDIFFEEVIEEPASSVSRFENNKNDDEISFDNFEPKKKDSSIERNFGTKLPVWIGGIAIALGGVFLVKYSIENSLLSPAVRVFLGFALGAVLLFISDVIRKKPDFANGVRISQALSGVSVILFYVVIYAAGSLYGMIPRWLGFVGMAANTALAVVLSLKHGPSIAILGLLGGFLTPALLSTGGGTAPALFTYVYFIFSGMMIVIRQQRWWFMSLPTIACAFAWVLAWLLSGRFSPDDSIFLGIFLVAISATIVVFSRRQYEDDFSQDGSSFSKPSSVLNYFGLAGSLLFMGFIAGSAGFTSIEWGLFAVLSLGAIGLAFFNDKIYGFVPLASMAVNAVMLLAWDTPDQMFYAIILACFAVIYTASGYLLMWRSRTPVLWAGLMSVSVLAYYLIAYYKLENWEFITSIPYAWSVIAFLLAAYVILAVNKVRDSLLDNPQIDYIFAALCIAATSFISLGLTIGLDREFLSVAIALEIIGIAWISSKISIKALRFIIMALLGVFGFLLFPQIVLLFQISMYSILEVKLRVQESVPLVDWPLFQLGIPALIFVAASIILRREKDDRIVRIFEASAIALTAVMGYYLTRKFFHVDENVLFAKAGFTERAATTNIIFLFSLFCMYIGSRYGRAIVSWGGVGLLTAGLFRVVYFDILIHNPLWSQQQILGVPVFNSLILAFGLTSIWAFMAKKYLIEFGREWMLKIIPPLILLFVFALVSLNVTHIFHGQYFESGITSNAEIYCYSVAWVMLAIGLLIGGIYKDHKMMRYASLGIMLLTVGKVFLFDISELDGLYRIFSFFGLGIILIGLSYFYTKFVFKSSD